MEIRAVRRPGTKGSRTLVEKYGVWLIGIRFRQDPARGKRYKVVEFIVAEQDWQPPPPHPQKNQRGSRPDASIAAASVSALHSTSGSCANRSKPLAECGTRQSVSGFCRRSTSGLCIVQQVAKR
jgi:hypothetical protein